MSIGVARIQANGGGDTASGVRTLEIVWYAVVLACVVGLAVLNLYQPLHGDSALFIVGAQAIDGGAVPYVDFWDNKQPGIYAFCWVAGRLFGFDERGVHLFEMLWMLAFTVFCCFALREWFRRRWLAGLVPLSVLAIYYVETSPHESTQLEALVGLPMLVSVWLLARSWQTSGKCAVAYAVAGVFAAISVVFKLALAPMFVLFVLFGTWEQRRRIERRSVLHVMKIVLSLWLAFTGGVVAILAIVVLAVASAGEIDAFLWTTFVYPWLVYGEIARGLISSAPVSRLLGGIVWYASVFAPWLVFTPWPALRAFRTDEPALTRMMLIWLVGAVVVILLQRFSWWTYHFNLLFVPTAALAVRGIDLALAYVDDALAERRRAVAVAVLLLVGLPLAAAVAPAAREARELVKSYKWATPQAGGEEGFYAGGWIALYQQRESPDYRRNMPMAQFLRDPSSLPGPIYVIGNPLIYLFSGRRQALPVNGWSLDWCVDALWQRLPRDIQTHRPVYIFIDEMFRSTLAERNPQVLETIGRLYTTQSVEPFGRWYRLAQP